MDGLECMDISGFDDWMHLWLLTENEMGHPTELLIQFYCIYFNSVFTNEKTFIDPERWYFMSSNGGIYFPQIILIIDQKRIGK